MDTKHCIVLALSILSFPAAPVAFAQNYPTKPIRMIVGFAASGGADTAARLVAQKLSDTLGQNVVVEVALAIEEEDGLALARFRPA